MIYLLFGCQAIENPEIKRATQEAQDTFVAEPDTEVAEPSDSPEPNSVPEDTNTDTAPPISEPSQEEEQNLLSEMIFKATHNSYTGAEKGSIVDQLDAGIRLLELDVHDNDYIYLQSYQIGHGSVGSEVSLNGGNPQRFHLQDWLETIFDWSTENPNHSLLTVVLDIKDDLTDNLSFEEGNLAALNDVVVEQFSTKLLRPSNLGAEVYVADTQGKIQVILSGDSDTRKGYKRDKGENPAIAVNTSGKVISVHDSGQGYLWYWTGQMMSNGEIEWKRHGRYGTGQLPAIALNNDGWFVEVHQSENHNTIWSHVGYIDSNYEAVFFSSEQYDNGQAPTIAFVDLNGTQLQEIHNSASTSLNWKWNLTLQTSNGTLNWSGNQQTNDIKYEKAMSQAGSYQVEIQTGTHKNAPSDTLLYSTPNVLRERIRYPQIAHVELQKNDGSELEDDETCFSATGSGDASSIETWNTKGYMSRMWEFDQGDKNTVFMTFPATDEPMENWYQTYMADALE